MLFGFIGVSPVLDPVYLEYTTKNHNDFFFSFILDGRTARSQTVHIKEEFATTAVCSIPSRTLINRPQRYQGTDCCLSRHHLNGLNPRYLIGSTSISCIKLCGDLHFCRDLRSPGHGGITYYVAIIDTCDVVTHDSCHDLPASSVTGP